MQRYKLLAKMFNLVLHGGGGGAIYAYAPLYNDSITLLFDSYIKYMFCVLVNYLMDTGLPSPILFYFFINVIIQIVPAFSLKNSSKSFLHVVTPIWLCHLQCLIHQCHGSFSYRRRDGPRH